MENELRESEERFRNLANNIPGVILRYVLHPDGTDGLHYISPGCFDLWGVSQEEALADVKKLWDRCLPEDIPSMYQSILSSAQGQTIWKHDWRICTTTGQIKWVSGTGIPSKQDNGDVIWDTIITDVTDRRRSQSELENLVKQRTKDLQASQQVLEEQLKREQHLLSIIQTELKQKDTLLKEVHHRVKNNLQIISSLMRLQVDNHQDQQLKASFQDSQNRIQSMALIHERLYRSDDLSQIDTQIYFKELTDYLCQTYNTNSQHIEVILNTPPILLEIDKAIPCGLIVNELFTNSLKYAFQNNDGGTITLTSQQLDQTYNLQIKDTGNGLPPDFDLSRSRSLGLRLVDRLVKQLRGSITMQYDKGMVFLIEFPL
jgi:PAS domain S-box-containing protein